MPMLQDIVRHFPQAQIDWVVEEAYVELLKLTTGITRILPFALRRWRKSLFSKATRAEIAAFRQALRAQEYDYVFDCQGLLKTGLIMGWTRTSAQGKKYGLGNASEGSGYEGISRLFHDHSIVLPARTHAVARARLLAIAAFGYAKLEEQTLSPAQFGLHTPLPARLNWMPASDYAVFFHGTAGAAKKWPQQDWVALGKYLIEQGWPLLLPWGSPHEKAEAETIAQAIGAGAQVLPALPMQDAVSLARLAGLVIGVDTGLTHIAAAYCRPTIEIYSASPRWKTEGNWSAQVVNLGDLGMVPQVAEVIHAVNQLCSAVEK